MNALEEGTQLSLDFGKLNGVAATGQAVVPVVLQNADSGEVLFVAYANREALDATLRTRTAVLWSTSRNELWHKGATSGDVLDLVEVARELRAELSALRGPPARRRLPHARRRRCHAAELLLSPDRRRRAGVLSRLPESAGVVARGPDAYSRTQSISDGRSREGSSKVSSEPTSRARCTEWTWSNSPATSACFSSMTSWTSAS